MPYIYIGHSAYIYIYIYVCVCGHCIYIYIYVCVCVCGHCIYIYIYVCVCVWDCMPVCMYVSKGKAVPLQAWSGPEGSRKLRFPDYIKTAQDGGRVVSHTNWPPLPPRNAPGTHF